MQQAPEQFRFAAMAVDIPVFGILDGELCGLVSDVNRPPYYVDMKGFLGGMVQTEETAEEAAYRVLKEKGDLTKLYLEQLYTFSEVERDKRNRVVSVAHLGLVTPDTISSYNHPEAQFMPIKEIAELAYDHDEMLQVALNRLQGKLSYTTIAQFLLPKHFTLTELQTVYEILQKTTLDKRNFRKKILSLDIVEDTGTTQEGMQNRPAALYTFKSRQLEELGLQI